MKQYRFIDWKNVIVSAENYPAVEKLLADAVWESVPTPHENGMVIAPRPKSYDAQDEQGIQVIYALAPYVAFPSKVILEVTDHDAMTPDGLKKWLHIKYDGNGGVSQEESAPHVWDA